jgi:hypothetical protein
VSLEFVVSRIVCVGHRIGGQDGHGHAQFIALGDHFAQDLWAPIKLMVAQANGVVAQLSHHLKLCRMAGGQQLKQRSRHPVAAIIENHWIGRRTPNLVNQGLGTGQPANRGIIPSRARSVLRIWPLAEHVALPVIGVQNRETLRASAGLARVFHHTRIVRRILTVLDLVWRLGPTSHEQHKRG